MKVVYMGTPDFAVPAMQKLHDAGYEIAYAVTQPDAVSGRGKKVNFPPVKEKALELGIEVLQPEKVRGNEEFIQKIADAAPDVIVVAAYGQILPQSVLDIPRLGCINIHGSLLPRFRGASPIQAAILAGDEETGVTIMHMAKKLDAGNMISKASTPIDKKTAGDLHDELAVLGAELLLETIPKLENCEGEVQDENLVTYAGMITKKDGEIDFTKSADEIERMSRAFCPWPGTFTHLGDKMLKIWKADAIMDKDTGKAPGTVVEAKKDTLEIACGEGVLKVLEIQAPGKKRVTAGEYLRGNSIEIGTVLG
ncbi:MAG: methionyl-tRNA formyltransferase [Firmicutes bacterium]|nr:methionyl-tRNA formyltransferase [Bacillota bacterium]